MRARHARTVVVLASLLTAACAVPAGSPVPAMTGAVDGAVWVANEAGNSLTVLDARTGAALATLTGLAAPHNVQTAADGSTAWAVSGEDQVVAFDAASLEVTALALTDEHPAHVVADPRGHVYVTAGGQPSVYAYDDRLRPLRRTPLPGSPHGVRLTGDGATAVVANTGAGTIEVIDTATGAVTASIPVGEGPVQVAVTPDGATAFVSLGGTSELARIDLTARTVTHRVPVPAAPAQILLTADGRLLSANQGTAEAPGDTVSVHHSDTLELLAAVRTGVGPHGVTSDADGRRAWVTNVADDSVTEIDLARLVAVRTVPVGDEPGGVSYAPTVPLVLGEVALDLPGREDRGEHGAGHGH